MGEQAILTAAPESEEPALADLRRALAPVASPSCSVVSRQSRVRHPTGKREEAAGPAIVMPATEALGAVAAAVRSPVRLAPGIVLIDLPGDFGDMAERLRLRPPIFIRHVQPVQRSVPNSGSSEDLPRLAHAALELAPCLDPNRSFSIQTRLLRGPRDEDTGSTGTWPYGRFEVNECLAAAVDQATGARLNVRSPDQIVSVFVTPEVGYVGLSASRDNLSAWAGGAVRFAREPEQVSRSEFKLLESLQVFDLELPSSGHALDLGASPGGWTRVLRRAGLEVTALDPGDLDPRIAQDPGVRHVRALAQRFRCQQGVYAVIVNDMRMDARDSARLMLDYAPCLSSQGWALATLKLPQHGAEQVAHQAIGLLLHRYRLIGARQLYHNRSEITVALRRSDEG